MLTKHLPAVSNLANSIHQLRGDLVRCRIRAQWCRPRCELCLSDRMGFWPWSRLRHHRLCAGLRWSFQSRHLHLLRSLEGLSMEKGPAIHSCANFGILHCWDDGSWTVQRANKCSSSKAPQRGSDFVQLQWRTWLPPMLLSE